MLGLVCVYECVFLGEKSSIAFLGYLKESTTLKSHPSSRSNNTEPKEKCQQPSSSVTVLVPELSVVVAI